MTDWFRPVVIFDDEDEVALKRDFALLWAKYPNNTPAEIGMQLFANAVEPMRGLQAGAVWSRELAVIAMRDDFILNGGDEDVTDIPSKEQVQRELIAIARGSRDPKVRLDAYRQFNEMAGHITKAGVNVNVNDNRVVNVLKVPVRDQTAEDDEDFDRRFKVQQLQLVADARSSRPN